MKLNFGISEPQIQNKQLGNGVWAHDFAMGQGLGEFHGPREAERKAKQQKPFDPPHVLRRSSVWNPGGPGVLVQESAGMNSQGLVPKEPVEHCKSTAVNAASVGF